MPGDLSVRRAKLSLSGPSIEPKWVSRVGKKHLEIKSGRLHVSGIPVFDKQEVVTLIKKMYYVWWLHAVRDPPQAEGPGRERERGQRQHGTAAVGGRAGPGEDPLPAQQEQSEQTGEQRDGRHQHPHLPGVVRVLQRRELLDAAEGEDRAVLERHRLADRQVGRADLDH